MKKSLRKTSIIIALCSAFSLAYSFHLNVAGASYQDASPNTQIPEVPDENDQQEAPKFEGTMTLERINEIVLKIDDEATRPQQGSWQFRLATVPLMIVTDTNNDRMRIMAPIGSASELTKEDLMRIAQANFDSALDARYAVAQDVLWAVYIHPLRALYDRQFVSALAQTATTAITYGKSYSSGAFVFGGGDSQGIIQQQLIDQLKDKGLAI